MSSLKVRREQFRGALSRSISPTAERERVSPFPARFLVGRQGSAFGVTAWRIELGKP